MKLLTLAIILPCLVEADLFQIRNEGCDFDRESGSYFCKNIKHQFPALEFRDYNLQCVDCEIPMFSKKTFPSRTTLLLLNISNSKISVITPYAFKNLKFLENLHLESNEIVNITENAFHGLRRLFELHLEKNKLSRLTPGFLNGCEASAIILSHNDLAEIRNDVFQGLHSIMILDLSYNVINTLNPDSLKYLNGLETLNLEGNDLCTLPIGVFKSIRSLRTLNMAHNRFSSFSLGLFSPLRGLLHLNISYNRLKIFDPNVFLPFRNIEFLDVSANALLHLDMMSIRQHISSIKWLVINDNFWSCHELTSIVYSSKSLKIDVSDHSLHRYDAMNINGIACLDVSIDKEEEQTLSDFLRQAYNAPSNNTYC